MTDETGPDPLDFPEKGARPGEETLYNFCRQIRKRLENDWDIVIGVCGEEGSGKSTLAILISKYLDKDFSCRRNIIASPNVQDVSENLLGKLPKYSPIVVDEAIKVMYKLGWHTSAQLMLNTVMSVCRAQNKVALLCMPRFLDFNEYNRQHRIKIWLEVVKRGHAFVFVRDMSPFVNDVWHLKENQEVYEKVTKHSKIVEMDDYAFHDALRNCKTFAFELTYSDLPQSIKNEYKQMKSEVAATLDVEETKGLARVYREAVKNLARILYTENGLTQTDLSKETGLALYTINKLLAEAGVRKIADRPLARKVVEPILEVEPLTDSDK